MNTTDFQNFEDFILEESFREYVQGTSESSVAFWNEWIKNHPEKENEIQKAFQILKTLLGAHKLGVTVDKNQALSNLIAKIEADREISENKRIIIPSWLKVAAVLILSLGLSWLWNFSSKFFQKEQAISFNEIIVPIGEKSQVILSDGTHVWINSGSKFKYPVNFQRKNREVYLTGEAFFDVTHQGNQAFVVNTRDAKVRVLGTAFNVKAYPEDSKTQAVVVRGLVSVQSNRGKKEEIFVRPNQMAVARKDIPASQLSSDNSVKGVQLIDKINTEALTCWKNQLLVFVDEPLEDMAMKMERWFNVRIQIEDSTLRKERYNGKFVHNETIYEVLEAIKQTTSIKYSVEDNMILIARK